MTTINRFHQCFQIAKPIIGMIHLQALPNTPNYDGSTTSIIEKATQEAILLQHSGIDALMIENMHDTPYLKGEANPEIVAMMSIIAYKIKQETQIPCGVQVLAGANKSALAIAKAGGLDFVRVEGFVFGHVADEGWIDGCAGELMRYRRHIEGEDILVLTDIKKKHSAHALTADVDIAETAKAAAFFRSDGVIVTGASTGQTADLEEIKEVKAKTEIPVLVGSGVNLQNVEEYLQVADALIVGSYFKKYGHWANELEKERVRRLMERVMKWRKD
ncbi:MAG: BtpA/SgcQ family protein [Chitinophagales bacterium]